MAAQTWHLQKIEEQDLRLMAGKYSKLMMEMMLKQ